MSEAERLVELFRKLSGLHVTHDLSDCVAEMDELLLHTNFEELRRAFLSYFDRYDELLQQRRGCSEDRIIWQLLFDQSVNRIHANLVHNSMRKRIEDEQNQECRYFLN